jgi:hypothetical protein
MRLFQNYGFLTFAQHKSLIIRSKNGDFASFETASVEEGRRVRGGGGAEQVMYYLETPVGNDRYIRTRERLFRAVWQMEPR